MFLGHFAIAMAAKKTAPKVSLGTLFAGAQLADLLWPIFLLLGWERVNIVPGFTRVTPFEFISYPYSHSLVALFLWGVLFGGGYFLFRRDSRGAIVLAACVVSHWLLDYIAHRPDMQISPHGSHFGLGLWNSLPATLLTEFTLFAAGIAIYTGTTRARNRRGTYVLWSLLIFLVIGYLAAVFGPPPPSVKALAASALGILLTIPWAAWADRNRTSLDLNQFNATSASE